MRSNLQKTPYLKWNQLGRMMVLCSILNLSSAIPTFSANISWDGGTGVNGDFSTGTNWNTDTAPINGDVLIFTAASGTVFGGTLTNDLPSLASINGLQFNTSYTGPLTINAAGGSALTLTGNVTSSSTDAVLDSVHFKNFNVLWNVPTTIGTGTNISFTSAANNATGIGAITLNGTGQLTSNSTTSNGLYITGAYTGSGSETVRSDGNRFTAGNQNGTLQNGFGGVVFQNGLTSNVTNLALGSSQSSNFAVQGKWNGVDYDPTTVHVTNSFKMYRGANTASEINVANGGRLIIDASATMGYNATPGAFNNVRANLGGDGNASNLIEFASTTVNLGTYFYPNGNSQARYGGTQVGGLNLTTHGTTWTLYKTSLIGLEFNGADGGGWTQKTNAMTVNATGTGTAGVTFSNNRFLDVQSSSFTFDSSVSFVNIATGKTLTKLGTGDFNFNAPATGTGTLLANAGTTYLNNAAFTPNLTIGASSTVIATASITPGAFLLNGGSLSGSGIITSSTAYDIRSGSIGSSLSGAQGLDKTTAGTATLNGTNDYTGVTTLASGRLVVNGSLSGSSIVVNGGIFAGIGTVITNNQTFDVESGARLDPGASPGLTINTGSSELNIGSAISGGNTGALVFALDTPASSDRITLTGGTLNIGSGNLGIDDFEFTTLGSFGNGSYTLFDGINAITGTLDSANLTGTLSGRDITLSMENGGTDVVLTVIPEPGSVPLMLGGFGILLGIQRMRRHSA